MRLPRVYQDLKLNPLNQAASNDGVHTLSSDAFNHLIRVLKFKVGHALVIFDGYGNEQAFQIHNIERRSADIKAVESVTQQPPQNLAIHLGQVLSKGERMDFAIQKSVELGVREITPLLSERCDVKLPADRIEKRIQHWQKVIISACEQCGQNYLPTLHAPRALVDWLPIEADIKWLMHTSPSDKTNGDGQTPQSLAVLIGPEGGLSEEEVEQAHKQNFTHIHLGPRILRTETAPIVALSLAQQRWGDFS